MPFNVGDLVKLRSGGPTMTVVGVPLEATATAPAKCFWFEHNQAGHPMLREAEFPLIALSLEQAAGDWSLRADEGMGEILARSMSRQQEMAQQKMSRQTAGESN